MKQKQQINIEQLGFHEKLQHELSGYPIKMIHDNSSVTIQRVQDLYFLVNNTWNVDFFKTIPQFQEMTEKYIGTGRNVRFQINSPTVNLEMKYVYYQKLFNDEWTLTTAFSAEATHLLRLTTFLNEKYSTLHSLLDLNIEKTEREWWFWLQEQGILMQRVARTLRGEYIRKSHEACFLRKVHSAFFALTDTREEWKKDRWDIRVLHDKYGVVYNKSKTDYYIDFTKIEQGKMRKQIKNISNNVF